MLFNSIIFLFFILLFFWGWFIAKKQNTSRWLYLCIASFIFYGWWDWRFLFLIIFSGLVDFVAGWLMQSNPERKRLWLILSLMVNIGSLSIFKYSTFFAQNLDALFGKIGLTTNLYHSIPEFALILPVGISFYTFQSMSYTIDIYRNRLEPTKNIFHFFAYLSMFPQLVAGPIIRAKNLLNQLTKHREVSKLEFWNGLKLIVVGFFQKTVLADNLGTIVNQSYNAVENFNGAAFWWISSICFALQIYFDFNGYSLIAKGIAKWMGYHFKMNFNHPYIAKSLKDFWQRWHISLSTWFRDYVYIPLGGNKKGVIKSHYFMWITMLISGLWHGAAFTFVIWGGIHALFLSLERIFSRSFSMIPNFIMYLYTTIQVLIAWIFFRAESTDQAFNVITQLFNFSSNSIYGNSFENEYYFLIIAILSEFGYFLSIKYKSICKIYRNTITQSVEMSILICACLFYRGPEQAFIYFQF